MYSNTYVLYLIVYYFGCRCILAIHAGIARIQLIYCHNGIFMYSKPIICTSLSSSTILSQQRFCSA